MLKRVLVGVIVGLGLVIVLQTWATVQQDGGGSARDFADDAAKSAELYRKCADEKDKDACDELERLNESGD